MTTLANSHLVQYAPALTSPCHEADWLEELQSKSRRIMIVDASADTVTYSVVTQWKAAQLLVDSLSNLCHQQLALIEADVISEVAIEERAEVVILLAPCRKALNRWLGQHPAAHIHYRTHLPVLSYS